MRGLIIAILLILNCLLFSSDTYGQTPDNSKMNCWKADTLYINDTLRTFAPTFLILYDKGERPQEYGYHYTMMEERTIEGTWEYFGDNTMRLLPGGADKTIDFTITFRDSKRMVLEGNESGEYIKTILHRYYLEP